MLKTKIKITNSALNLALTIAIACAASFSLTNSTFAANNIEDFITEAHESFEGEETKPSTIKEFATHWKEKFNFKKVFLSALRWSNVQIQDEKFRDHALNLAMILPVSHAIEMTAGPVLFYTANQLDASATVQSLIAIGGATITIPGLDPLCLVLIASYKLEPVQKAFTATRIAVYRASKTIADKTHMKDFARHFLKKESRLDLILSEQEAQLVTFEQNSVSISFAPKGEALLSVKINTENKDKTYVERLEYKKGLTKDELKAAKKWLTSFGLNTRSALYDLISERDSHGFHIERIESIEASTQVHLKPFSLLLRPRLRLKLDCEGLLGRG